METISLNDALELTFPDGFRKLDGAELRQLLTVQSGPSVCLRNDDSHVIVSLGFRRAGLLSALLNGGDLIKSAQSRIAGVMRPYHYRLTGFAPCQVGGKEAQRFRYAYTAQNTDMVGECRAIQEGKTIYCLHFYVREAFSEEGLRLWEDILSDARWS